MSQKELAAALAVEHGVSQAAATAIVKSVGAYHAAELAQDGKTTVTGIGNFTVKTRAAREGRNPSTGESLHIPEKKVVKFSCLTALEDVVNA
jgi:DNA-binding protein HU-beta